LEEKGKSKMGKRGKRKKMKEDGMVDKQREKEGKRKGAKDETRKENKMKWWAISG